MKPGVIVLGGHVQGYGIVRIFGENDILSVVIDTSRYNIARHSKYCVKFFRSSYEEIIDLLLNLGKKDKYIDWLLIPTDDYYVRLLSINKNILSKYFKVAVDNWEVVNLFYNKRNSYQLVKEVGVPIPKTFYPNSIDDLKVIDNSIVYPCIIKPAIMLDFYRHFKQKVFVCNNFDELKQNYFRAIQIIKPEEILVQEIIPGSSEHLYSAGIFFDRNKSYNYLVARRKRQHPIDFGNATTFAETVVKNILIEYSLKILSKAKFWGICEVEFKYDERDKKYKFLEVNPRTWKWHTIAVAAGIPFLMSMYNYLTEGYPIIKKDYKSVGWRDVITDLPTILKMIRKNVFSRSQQKMIIHAVLNLKDFNPFIYQLIYLPYLFLKR